MKKILTIALFVTILVMPKAYAEFSLDEGISKTISSKKSLAVAGAAIVFFTRAGSILLYSPKLFTQAYFMDKAAEIVACTLASGLCLFWLGSTVMYNSFN